MAQNTIRYFLGVDGGSSKTHALLVDESGQVQGFGQAGSGNHQSRGLEPALFEIASAVETALEETGLPAAGVEMGCFCLAGADLPEDYAMLQEAIQHLSLARSIIIRNDTMAALRAGISRPWGVVVICGTGFNAAGRSPGGQEIVLPGLGDISGDWGGGGALSQEMIRLVMRAWDGRGKPTLLTRYILDALEVPSEEVLLSRLYHQEIDDRRLLGLVPLLFDAAEAGDLVARELIIRMGREVGVTANTLIRRLGLEGEDPEVILGGSVFKGRGTLLLDTVIQTVKAYAPKAFVKRLRHEPVVGAVFLALEAVGISVDQSLKSRTVNTLPGLLRAPVLKGRPSPEAPAL